MLFLIQMFFLSLPQPFCWLSSSLSTFVMYPETSDCLIMVIITVKDLHLLWELLFLFYRPPRIYLFLQFLFHLFNVQVSQAFMTLMMLYSEFLHICQSTFKQMCMLSLKKKKVETVRKWETATRDKNREMFYEKHCNIHLT